MTDIREQVREQAAKVAEKVRDFGDDISTRGTADYIAAAIRSMPLTDVPVAQAGQAGIEELREALIAAKDYLDERRDDVHVVYGLIGAALSRLQPSEQSEREKGGDR